MFDIFKKRKEIKDAEELRQNLLFTPPSKYDELLTDAAVVIIQKNKASIGMLQYMLEIPFSRADNLMNQLELVGIVGSEKGVRPREILIKDKDEAIKHINNICSRTYLSKTAPSINIDIMEGHDFEYFCADILKKNGFINVEVTRGSGDHGIDVLAEKDDITYAIQCKCYSSNIGNAAVQQAHTGKSLYHRDVAVVMTNQYFTQQAKEEAESLRVKLWDRDKLNEFIGKSNI